MSDLQLPLTLLTAVNPYPYPRNTVPSLVECAFNTLPHEIKERIEQYQLLSRPTHPIEHFHGRANYQLLLRYTRFMSRG